MKYNIGEFPISYHKVEPGKIQKINKENVKIRSLRKISYVNPNFIIDKKYKVGKTNQIC